MGQNTNYPYQYGQKGPSAPGLNIPAGSRTGKNVVDMPSSGYLEMVPKWELIEDLMGGTLAMRSAGKKWLPPESRENAVNYEARLNRSYLYGAFKDTIQKLSSKPFSKPVAISGSLQDPLDMIVSDADLRGRDLTQFARMVFEDGLKYGMAHVLVDYPNTGGGLSRGAERSQGIYPYFCHIRPTDLLA